VQGDGRIPVPQTGFPQGAPHPPPSHPCLYRQRKAFHKTSQGKDRKGPHPVPRRSRLYSNEALILLKAFGRVCADALMPVCKSHGVPLREGRVLLILLEPGPHR
jgi:hypothetical protein